MHKQQNPIIPQLTITPHTYTHKQSLACFRTYGMSDKQSRRSMRAGIICSDQNNWGDRCDSIIPSSENISRRVRERGNGYGKAIFYCPNEDESHRKGTEKEALIDTGRCQTSSSLVLPPGSSNSGKHVALIWERGPELTWEAVVSEREDCLLFFL